MINRVIISLPYPTRVGFFLKKKIGFSFDNLSAFLVRENLGIKTPDDFQEWLKINGNNMLYIETVFAAAQSYCMHNRLRFKLEKSKFIKALAMMDKETGEQLMRAWTTAETYGGKELPKTGKKKV